MSPRSAACLTLMMVAAAWGAARSEDSAIGGTVRAPVVMYHHVQKLTGDPGKAWLRYTVSPEEFEKQADWLEEHGYQTVTAKRLCEAVSEGAPLPAKPVALTFDDGWACCYTTVFPILRQHEMVATFFVYPAGIGSPGYLTWDNLREMQAAGMDVQAHSVTHPNLKAIAASDALREITRCREQIGEQLGEEPEVFAYPFGEYDAKLMEMVKSAGYLGAFSTDPGTTFDDAGVYKLPRVLVTYTDPIETFAKVVESNGAGTPAPASAPSPAPLIFSAH